MGKNKNAKTSSTEINENRGGEKKAIQEQPNDLEQLLKQITGSVDYFRTCYLVLFVLTGICILMYMHFEEELLKNSMVFFIILCGALGASLRSFELKLEKAEQKEKDKT